MFSTFLPDPIHRTVTMQRDVHKIIISASEPQEFVPYGREYTSCHPDGFSPPSPTRTLDGTSMREHGVPIKSFSEVSMADTPKKESWSLQAGGEGEVCDEELYTRGNTVVWSRGGQSATRMVIRSFTVPSPVQEALWCRFEFSRKEANKPVKKSDKKVMSGIAVVETSCVNIYTKEGEEYIAPLQFQAQHTWSTKYGLLFERSISEAEITSPKRGSEALPKLFSMCHPLDELCPVVCKYGGPLGVGKLSYVNDPMQHVVFTSADPSLVMTYDTVLGVHSVWTLRTARNEEVAGLSSTHYGDTSTIPSMPSSHHVTTPLAGLSSSTQSRLSLSQSPSLSPAYRTYSRPSTPGLSSRSHSPAVLSHMATLSRCQSPAPNNSSSSKSLSYSISSPWVSRSPANMARTPASSCSFASPGRTFESYLEMPTPLTPEVCMDHVWTETMTAKRDGVQGQASKAFLMSDVCGQKFLCYLIGKKHELRCVKFEPSNDNRQLIFGAITKISARDAIALQSLNMMIVLDLHGSVVLYTGISKVGKVYLASLSSSHGLSLSTSLPRAGTPLDSPVPGTSSRAPSAMNIHEEVVLLSPVPELGNSSKLQGSTFSDDFSFHTGIHINHVRDPVANRFTLELNNGKLCSTSIPEMATSPLVKACLAALRTQLPKDIAVQLFVKWYTTHNAPGSPSQSEWSLFVSCLLSMMGYNTGRLSLTNPNLRSELNSSMSPVIAAKKARSSEQGSNEDWDYLLSSTYHHSLSPRVRDALTLKTEGPLCIRDDVEMQEPATPVLDPSDSLFPHMPLVLSALHLVYEDQKLHGLSHPELEQIAAMLCQLASDLCLDAYMDHYRRDFPCVGIYAVAPSNISQSAKEQLQFSSSFPNKPPSILHWLYQCMLGRPVEPFPHVAGVCDKTKNVIMLYSLYFQPLMKEEARGFREEGLFIKRLSAAGHRDGGPRHKGVSLDFKQNYRLGERVVLHMTEIGMTAEDLEMLPFGVSLPLRVAIHECRCSMPTDFPAAAYKLIGSQQSLGMQLKSKGKGLVKTTPEENLFTATEDDDGMDTLDQELLKLRFPDDLRVQEVRKLLQSSKPATVHVVQKPEVSDHDYLEEQEMKLLSVCQRTMALPVGRGMFTLCTYHPVLTEPLPIPKLNLTGKAPAPRTTTIELSRIEVPTNMNMWPSFHNGVAAGLKVAPESSKIESSWIVYNKPKSADLTNEHAGFLMALGLNGYLSNLNTLNLHDYLNRGHELTSVGVLLGVAAAKRGTMDAATTRMLSIHVPALLIPTTTELDIAHNVQVAAVMGVGLVYQGTGHRHMAEVLLQEIGRPPGPEMENCTDRESYSLAAGLALGMVTFGLGGESGGLADLNMADQLYHFMVGGHKKPLMGPQKDKFKSPSYSIKEGDQVNIDVTASGATIALGMMFFRTNNQSVAQWLSPPDTQFLLEFVRPDFLMLRVIAKGLVMWDSIQPTKEWIWGNIPKIVEQFAFKQKKEEVQAQATALGIDYQTVSQAKANIVAGACLVLGLRFAGTANQEAYQTLFSFANDVILLTRKQSLVEQAGRHIVEACLVVIVVSLSLVMAGTGDLGVLRICRHLHHRMLPEITYGMHMAVHSALGLLFLGGGRYSLNTSPESIAVLLCALFPKYPAHSNDNRYHLQALRHLYVLAAEPRLLLPRDVDTNKACYTKLQLIFKETQWHKECSVETMAPSILPEISRLRQISILGPRYWPITIDTQKNADMLRELLKNGGVVYVKQRAGHMSFSDDPKGFRSLLAQSSIGGESRHHSVTAEEVKSFSSDPNVEAFADYFCTVKTDTEKEQEKLSCVASLLYECITQEKPDLVPTHLAAMQVVDSLQVCPSSLQLAQVKLLLAFHKAAQQQGQDRGRPLLSDEFLLSLRSKIDSCLDQWLKRSGHAVGRYIREGVIAPDDGLLSCFLVFYSIPPHHQLVQSGISMATDGSLSIPELVLRLKELSLPTSSLIKMLSALSLSHPTETPSNR
ncbi:anaphase-promoting complex subunit 1-like isoform X1 [Branchiostoma floridae]|uniref:Anaphase-promoting complex subunit 1-like isoform X1 n=1 Tax=Branchiostoma floridae TaxID=7739 RepID=A0A9J7LR26_BRAFL|nr:anaphase-promoting complex subunit 1-like isoform X1 [Branchiostoma floridae]